MRQPSSPLADERDGAANRRPLFITRFSLSPRTAIGQQTRWLINGVANARHLYWEDLDFRGQDRRSTRLERLPLSRLGVFKRPGPARQLAERLRFSRWDGDSPSPALARQVRALAKTTSTVYLAPIGGGDAARMLRLVDLLDRPYVVHLWDLLDGAGAVDAPIRRLVAGAQELFCLVPGMGAAVGRSNARQLLFVRDDTPCRATPPLPGEPLQVVLIGDIVSYRSGMADLATADALLREKEIRVRWIYIGNPAFLKRIDPAAAALLEPTGFFALPADRDARLAQCQFAFLPGPREAPEEDHRSRFSIPSRVLDFTATGLPVLGFVHPRSATADFAAALRDTMCLPGSEELAATIERLQDAAAWRAASEAARSVFDLAAATEPVSMLAQALG